MIAKTPHDEQKINIVRMYILLIYINLLLQNLDIQMFMSPRAMKSFYTEMETFVATDRKVCNVPRQ